MFGVFEIIVFTLWTVLVVYATWYFTSANHYAPITPVEARILWKIHKRNIRCGGKRWREVIRGGKIVGFECECGYKHIQKRPIVSNIPTQNVKPQTTRSSKLEQLHTPSRST